MLARSAHAVAGDGQDNAIGLTSEGVGHPELLSHDKNKTMDLQLQEIVFAHCRWLETDGQSGKRANFRGLDLSHQYFPAVELSRASFRNAILDGAKFEGTRLEDADFSEAHAFGTAFEDCNLTRALFSRGNLEGIRFRKCKLDSANFLQAKAFAIRMTDCVARFANFREAFLSGAEWQRSVFEEAVFRSAVLHHARLSDVSLTRADCREADFSGSQCRNVVWLGANARGSSFEDVLLEDSDLAEAEELDPTAISQTGKNLRQQLEEQKKELQRESLRLEAMREGLRLERKKLDAVWERLSAEKKHWGATGVAVLTQAKRLRFVAALWFIITAALTTQIISEVLSAGVGAINLLEVVMVAGLMLFVLGLHIAAALCAYRASRSLWRLNETSGEEAAEVTSPE